MRAVPALLTELGGPCVALRCVSYQPHPRTAPETVQGVGTTSVRHCQPPPGPGWSLPKPIQSDLSIRRPGQIRNMAGGHKRDRHVAAQSQAGLPGSAMGMASSGGVASVVTSAGEPSAHPPPGASPPSNGAVSPSVLLGQTPDAQQFRQSLWRHLHFPEFHRGGETKRNPGGAQQSKLSSQKLQQARQHGSPARSGCIR